MFVRYSWFCLLCSVLLVGAIAIAIKIVEIRFGSFGGAGSFSLALHLSVAELQRIQGSLPCVCPWTSVCLPQNKHC